MPTIPEVDKAKELMNEAIDWSAFKWLMEKTRLRQAGDAANSALDQLNQSVRSRWNGDAKALYTKLSSMPLADRQGQIAAASASANNSELLLLIQKVVEADDAAHTAAMQAQEAFNQAEKQMSIGLAKDGCRKAIYSWELHEQAIGSAEAVEQANRRA